jgi:hypothetical protein
MPPNTALHAGAFSNEIAAMVRQQANLHRPLVQIGGREGVNTILDDRPGDCERVDLIRLPRRALAAPGGAHPMWRDAHDTFAGSDQRLLEAA